MSEGSVTESKRRKQRCVKRNPRRLGGNGIIAFTFQAAAWLCIPFLVIHVIPFGLLLFVFAYKYNIFGAVVVILV